MNKKSIFYITLILVFTLMNLGFNSKNNTIYEDNNIKKYLDQEHYKHTGYPAIDFLYGMIPHHKAAVEMSKSLLKYGGQNAEIKK